MSEDLAPKPLTRKQLAAARGLSLSTIDRLKKKNLIRFIQPSGKGGWLRFPADALTQTQQVEQTPPPAIPPALSPKTKKLSGRAPQWKTD